MAKASLDAMLRETDERYRSIFFTEWDARLDVTREIARERDLGTDHDRYSELVAGLSTVPQKAEGSQYDYYAPQEGKEVYFRTYIHKFAFKATEELRDFGNSGQINEYAALQSEICDHTIKVSIYNLLNRAFSSSYPTEYDAVELCKTSHALAGAAGTASNRLGTDADLTETSLEAMIELLLKTPNEDGVYIGRTPSLLITSSAQWGQNVRLTRSTMTTLQGSGESGNAINAATNAYNLKTHVSPLITDTDASFVMADKSPFLVAWTRRPTLKPVVVDDQTDDWIWRVKMQYAVIAETWRGIVGTTGA